MRLLVFLLCLNIHREIAAENSETCQTNCESSAPLANKLVMDVDVGNDDAWALLMAASRYVSNSVGAELIAITCVHGNTEVDHVIVNVLKILKTIGRLDIPVYRGLDRSLISTPPDDNYYGKDGFGDFEFIDPPKPEDYLKKEHAVNALVRIVNENPGEVTLLALGPLTNIALAIRMDPGFLNKLKRLVVLGGSVKGVGNILPGIEFNFYIDPHAAHIVLNLTENPICLFPWELAMDSRLSGEWRKNTLGKLGSLQVELMNKAEHIQNFTKDYWLIADGFTTAAILKPDLITVLTEASTCGGRKYFASVETDGLQTKGIIVVDYDNSLNREPNVEIVDHIDKEKFKDFLLKCVE